jgi:hypothetical protein
MSDQAQENLQSLANPIFGRNDSFHRVVDVTSREFSDLEREHRLDWGRHLGAPLEWQSPISTATRLSSSWEEAWVRV